MSKLITSWPMDEELRQYCDLFKFVYMPENNEFEQSIACMSQFTIRERIWGNLSVLACRAVKPHVDEVNQYEYTALLIFEGSATIKIADHQPRNIHYAVESPPHRKRETLEVHPYEIVLFNSSKTHWVPKTNNILIAGYIVLTENQANPEKINNMFKEIMRPTISIIEEGIDISARRIQSNNAFEYNRRS